MNWRPRKRVYKLPDGKAKTVWVARYSDDRGRVRIAKPVWNGHKGTFDLKREAQRAIDEAIAQRMPERASTVSGYLDRWLETRPRSERTDQTNRGRIRAALQVDIEGLLLEDWDMRDLRRRHAHELVAHMLTTQGRSPGGGRNILRALSAMFEDAISDELCEVNPWTGVRVRDDDRRATKRTRPLRVWAFEEMHEFASYAGRHEPMIRTLSDCGLRVGELFALRRADLGDGLLHLHGGAWEGRVVESTPEKNHDRTVPVPLGLQELLRSMPVQLRSPWLFPSPSGTLWRYSNWHRRVWQRVIERANTDRHGRTLDPKPHEFRHSWVTLLRADGIDPADLADVAGHSVQTASSRYTHPLRRSYEQIRETVG